MFVQFDITGRDTGHYLRGHFGNLLPGLSLETFRHQPFSHELFGQLFLGVAFRLAFGISVRIEIAGRVRGVYFVDQGDNSVYVFSEFVFSIHQDEPARSGHFGSPFEKPVRVFFQGSVILFPDDTAGKDAFAGDVLIVGP